MKKKKRKVKIPKGRWLPNDNTRARTFTDRKKQASKNACRHGPVAEME